MQLAIIDAARGRARADHQVDRRERVLVQSKRLTHESTEPVALDRASRRLLRDGKPEARRAGTAFVHDDREVCISQSAPVCVDRVELRLAAQAPLSRKRQTLAGGAALAQSAIRERVSCDPSRGAGPGPYDRSWWPCARGTRACACGAACSVEMFSSWTVPCPLGRGEFETEQRDTRRQGTRNFTRGTISCQSRPLPAGCG